MSLLVTHVLRGLQLLFAIIVLGLGADACHEWGYYSPSQTSFIVFCAIWTLLAVAYFMLAPRFFEPAAHPFVMLAVDALTMLFWFAGFIALAVLVAAVAPLASLDDDEFNRGYFWASTQWYHVAAAATAFGAFEWILFVATTVLSGLGVMNKGRGTSAKGPANPEISTTV